MIDGMFYSPYEIAHGLAKAVQQKRLAFNYSQKTLSERSGVSLGTLKKFEVSGQISLMSLLKIALALDSLNEFLSLFKAKSTQDYRTMHELLKDKVRKRGRQ